MIQNFERINPDDLQLKPFDKIGNEWMLVTAGTIDHVNTMTASWGTLGILWGKPIAICFIRPQRYTFEFIEKNDYYTLSFFNESDKNILKFCGAKSGRDVDKIKETGLKPVETPHGNVIFDQNELALECKKLYTGRFKEENFLVKELIAKNYPTSDFHSFYIGEVVEIYMKPS